MLHGKKIQVILKLYDKMKTFLFGKKAFFQFNGLIVVALINCTSPSIFFPLRTFHIILIFFIIFLDQKILIILRSLATYLTPVIFHLVTFYLPFPNRNCEKYTKYSLFGSSVPVLGVHDVTPANTYRSRCQKILSFFVLQSEQKCQNNHYVSSDVSKNSITTQFR